MKSLSEFSLKLSALLNAQFTGLGLGAGGPNSTSLSNLLIHRGLLGFQPSVILIPLLPRLVIGNTLGLAPLALNVLAVQTQLPNDSLLLALVLAPMPIVLGLDRGLPFVLRHAVSRRV